MRRGTGKTTPAALAALLLFGLGACATDGADDGPAASPGARAPELLGALQHVRENPEDRSSTQAYCLLTVPHSEDDFPIDAFLAGLFDVPADESMRVFCDAIVEAVIAGELTDEDLTFLSEPPGAHGPEPLGVLLRKLMTARERLMSQQVERPDPGASRPATSAS